MKIGVKHKVAGIVMNKARNIIETANTIVNRIIAVIIFQGSTTMYSRGSNIHQK